MTQDKKVEITAAKQNIEKRMKRNDSPRDPWDNIKCTNFCTVGMLEGERKDLRKYLKRYQL